MKKVGGMWILDKDPYFENIFSRTYDKFDPGPIRQALKYVTGWRTALDGGAHYGSATRLIAGSFMKVIAAEPNPETYACLLRNTKEFTNVTCLQQALGDSNTPVFLGIAPEKMRFIGTREEILFCNSGCMQVLGSGDIPMGRIDELGLTDLDFLKLDLEGMEYSALLGARKTLEHSHPVVIIEDTGLGARYGYKKNDCRDFLGRLGYSCVFQGQFGDYIYVFIPPT